MPSLPISYFRERASSGNLLMFCGAGISAGPPANLPVAAELMKAVLYRHIGDLIRHVKEIAVRPEVLFQIILQTDKNHLLGILRDMLYASDVNQSHRLAAGYLAKHNPVVTTNFDLLIETACKLTGVDLEVTTLDFNHHGATPTLFKVHGSLDSEESLIVTINQLRAGLGASRIRTLRALALKRTILVLGYSGNDQLDIMPALREAPYSDIFWINHDSSSSSFHQRDSPSRDIVSLPRLSYYSGPTNLLIADLLGEKVIEGRRSEILSGSRIALELQERAKICIDLLMHQNNYREIVGLRRVLPAGNLFSDLKIHEARSVLFKRDARWRRRIAILRERLFSLSSEDQAHFLSEIAKYADTEGRLASASWLVNRALEDDAAIPEIVVEAGVELVYELIYRRYYEEAERILCRLDVVAQQSGYALQEARIHIERAYYAAERFSNWSKDSQLLADGEKAANTALFLLGGDILHDSYFLNQAKVNKARLLALGGNFTDAGRLYSEALAFFRTASPNSAIITLYFIAWSHFAEGDDGLASESLEEMLSMNRIHGRRLYLGFAYRLEALMKMRQDSLATHDKAISALLRKSVRFFKAEHNRHEAVASQLIEDEYNRQVNSATPALPPTARSGAP